MRSLPLRSASVGRRLTPRLVLAVSIALVASACDDDDDDMTAPPQNQAPSAQIDAPEDGATFQEGDEVEFSGSADDPEDGALTGDALVWDSDIDGQIGTGTAFATAALSVGSHTITLTATDSDGATGTASIGITVEAAGGGQVVEMTIEDDAFVDPEGRRNENASVTIDVGDTVRWTYLPSGQSQHTVTSGEGTSGSQGDGLPPGAATGLASGILQPGDTFEFTFDTPGEWTYFCEVHPTIMLNSTVVVQEP